MAYKKTPTVEEHLKQEKALLDHIKEANALVKKLKGELEKQRQRLEWMDQFLSLIHISEPTRPY